MKKSKKKQHVQVKFSIAWYKPEQWQRLREISADADKLEATFEEWLAVAEKALVDFAARGGRAEKIVVDTEELLIWCNERNLPVNGESRSRYAGWLLGEMDKHKGKGQR